MRNSRRNSAGNSAIRWIESPASGLKDMDVEQQSHWVPACAGMTSTGDRRALATTRRALLPRHVQIRDRPFEHFRRHADGFGEGRVRVDGEADVGGLRAHLDRE